MRRLSDGGEKIQGDIIGIVGSVGPYAGLDLTRKVFDHTLAGTEPPIALPSDSLNGMTWIDPAVILARALIRETHRGKLKPLSG